MQSDHLTLAPLLQRGQNEFLLMPFDTYKVLLDLGGSLEVMCDAIYIRGTERCYMFRQKSVVAIIPWTRIRAIVCSDGDVQTQIVDEFPADKEAREAKRQAEAKARAEKPKQLLLLEDATAALTAASSALSDAWLALYNNNKNPASAVLFRDRNSFALQTLDAQIKDLAGKIAKSVSMTIDEVNILFKGKK